MRHTTTDSISLVSISRVIPNLPQGDRKSRSIRAELLKIFVQFYKNSAAKLVFPAVRKLFFLYKEQLYICLATAAIGAIFLVSILFFFTQLAKYGW